MAKIRIKRGLKSQIPTLLVGEFGLCTDTKELYIGTDTGNVKIYPVDGSSGGVELTDVTDSTINGNILVNGQEIVVYTHPTTHPPTVIVQDANNRFVSDNEKSNWNSKAAGTHNHSISSVNGLQSIIDDFASKISALRTDVDTLKNGGTVNPPPDQGGLTVDWTYDFIVPQSTGTYNLKNDVLWTHWLTNQDVYGPNLDGIGGKVKLLSRGVQDGAPDDPGQQVPRQGFDTFTAPSTHGPYQFNEELQQIMFQSTGMNPYYFRLVKYL